MNQPLTTRIENIGKDCFSLDETPRDPELAYTLVIKSKKVPFRQIRNLFYLLIPIVEPERAHELRAKLISQYHLEQHDIAVYARHYVYPPHFPYM